MSRKRLKETSRQERGHKRAVLKVNVELEEKYVHVSLCCAVSGGDAAFF